MQTSTTVKPPKVYVGVKADFRPDGMMLPRIITWEDGGYRTECIDSDTGCANLMHFVNAAGQDVLVGTNREINEVAMYTITA